MNSFEAAKTPTDRLPPTIHTVFLPLFPETQTTRLPRRSPLRTLSPATNPPITSFKHPALSEDVLLLRLIHIRVIILGLAFEKVEDILHTQFPDSFTALNSSLGQLAFGFLEFENTLFDRVVDAEAVYGDVDGLVEAVDAVDGLFLDELSRTLADTLNIFSVEIWR